MHGVRGNPGHFSVRFYQLRDPQRPVYKADRLPGRSGDFRFRLDDMRVDLRKGKVKFDGASPIDVAAKCCLAVSVATLYVLSQPRPPGPPSAHRKRMHDANGRRIRHIDSESVVMVVAAGFFVDTPCNSHYMATVYGGGCGGCGGTWGGTASDGGGDDGAGGACGGCGGCGGGGGCANCHSG